MAGENDEETVPNNEAMQNENSHPGVNQRGRRTIETLSPDAQKYVSTAMLLQEFINEHDTQLAQAFREKHGL